MGTDKVYVYSISDEGMLKQHSDFQVESGGGPRHLDFFKDFCFVVTELTSEVYFCSFSVENGLEFQSKFSMIEVLCKISLEFDNSFKFEKNSFYPAAIKVSNNTVFVSVRSFGLKKNFILCFSINEKDKTLKFEKHFFVDGVPRDFYVDEDFLLVAAQSGHTITSIKLDGTKTNQIPCKAPTNILKLE